MKKYLVYNFGSHCILWKYLEGSNNQYMCIQSTDKERIHAGYKAVYICDDNTLKLKTDSYQEAIEAYLMEVV